MEDVKQKHINVTVLIAAISVCIVCSFTALAIATVVKYQVQNIIDNSKDQKIISTEETQPDEITRIPENCLTVADAYGFSYELPIQKDLSYEFSWRDSDDMEYHWFHLNYDEDMKSYQLRGIEDDSVYQFAIDDLKTGELKFDGKIDTIKIN